MSDERQEPSGETADATRPLPPSADRATPGEPVDATRPMPRADETAVQPEAAKATARREPVEPTASLPPTPRAWSGRAEVPPPRPVGYQEPATEWYTDEQPGRRWWMPILLGILALLLIALIGVGLWLALRGAQAPEPSPAPSFSPTSAPATSAAPTSAAPSTEPPTTPPTTAAARVPMPPLVGMPEATARAILDRLDVDYRVKARTSDRPAGTVIETDPEAGELISEGERVTVVVAEAPAPTTGAGAPTPSPAATATS